MSESESRGGRTRDSSTSMRFLTQLKPCATTGLTVTWALPLRLAASPAGPSLAAAAASSSRSGVLSTLKRSGRSLALPLLPGRRTGRMAMRSPATVSGGNDEGWMATSVVAVVSTCSSMGGMARGRTRAACALLWVVRAG